MLQIILDELGSEEINKKRKVLGYAKEMTPVRYAAELGREDIVRYLIQEKGAKGPFLKLLVIAKKKEKVLSDSEKIK